MFRIYGSDNMNIGLSQRSTYNLVNWFLVGPWKDISEAEPLKKTDSWRRKLWLQIFKLLEECQCFNFLHRQPEKLDHFATYLFFAKSFSPKLAKWNSRLANHFLPKKVLFFAKSPNVYSFFAKRYVTFSPNGFGLRYVRMP